jgi:alpha-glucosidase
MLDTSFAITPDKEKTTNKHLFKPIGKLISYKQDDQTLECTCENGYVSLIFYQQDTIRILMDQEQRPSKQSSFAVIQPSESVAISVDNQSDKLKIMSNLVTVVINKADFTMTIINQTEDVIVSEEKIGLGYNENNQAMCYKQMETSDHFYGFGQKTGYLDKRGEKLSMWNTDVFAPHNPSTDELYQSIPFFIAKRQKNAYGLFVDNTSRTVFDLKSSMDCYSFIVDERRLDYYLFVGPSVKNILAQYTKLTGTMPLPPKWSLGYHQSRYSYKSEREVRDLVKTFREKDIPLDAVYLDIHYMDGYRVFTFDRTRFPNPKQLVSDLQAQGVRIVPIVDPGVKRDAEYDVYKDGVNHHYFSQYIDGTIYHGDVWPGSSAFPDFTNTQVRTWWGKRHQFYTDLGIEGVWNDMNEPSVFNDTKTMDLAVIHENDGNPKTHRELHNIYGLMMGAATYHGLKQQLDNKRPFLLTRAGYAGVQRYATVWTGDNRSFWEHLQMTLPMCLNLGLSGVAFCGPDVGGFANDSNGELLTRWTQVGLFTPYFRNHSVLESIHQEPWSFGEHYEKIIKRYINERYVWLPYLYTLFKESSETGLPVMRPLFLEYPDDQETNNLYDQFLVGEHILVAPILTPSTNHRVVYLPEGNWIDYWTDKCYQGKQYHLIQADIDILPIFIKEGAIVPLAKTKSSTQVLDDELEIHVYPKINETHTFNYYEDDGLTFDYQSGQYYLAEVNVSYNSDELTLHYTDKHTGYKPSWSDLTFVLHGLTEQTSVELVEENNHQISMKIIKKQVRE